jgi:guanine deaminase
LATVGGAEVLGMGDVVGNFKRGKKLDCLVIDVDTAGGPIDLFGDETNLQKFEKFLFLGDDRNIQNVLVDGRVVI